MLLGIQLFLPVYFAPEELLLELLPELLEELVFL
jgi:hypothetical protein